MSCDFGAETDVTYPRLNGNCLNAEMEIKISLYTEISSLPECIVWKNFRHPIHSTEFCFLSFIILTGFEM